MTRYANPQPATRPRRTVQIRAAAQPPRSAWLALLGAGFAIAAVVTSLVTFASL
jgi:hypothetical protein